MSDRAYAKVQIQQKTLSGLSPNISLLQRTCACGQHTVAGGECTTCRNERSTLLLSQRVFGPPSALATVQGNAPAQEHVPSFNSAVNRTSRFGHDFSRIPSRSTQTAVPQTKLKINQPEDVYEQEADQVAEQMMRMADQEPFPTDDGEQTERSLSCKQETESSIHLGTNFDSVPPIVHSVLNSGGGQPLDTITRAFMEPRFGHDFSNVRVHTDAKAAESARAVNAKAYTVGHDVIFGTGQYIPGTPAGQQLLAHELTHVVQQSNSYGASGSSLHDFATEVSTHAPEPKSTPWVLRRQPVSSEPTKQERDEIQLRRLAARPGLALEQWRKLKQHERDIVLREMIKRYGDDFGTDFLNYAEGKKKANISTTVANTADVTPETLTARGYRRAGDPGAIPIWVHPSGHEVMLMLPSKPIAPVSEEDDAENEKVLADLRERCQDPCMQSTDDEEQCKECCEEQIPEDDIRCRRACEIACEDKL